MGLLKKILTRFNGLYYPQEYLCFAEGSFKPILHVYLVSGDRVVKDIGNCHVFNGYCPLIFTFSSASIDHRILRERVEIIFTPELLKPNEFLTLKFALAGLFLKRIHQQTVNGTELFFYAGLKGWHRFIPGPQQYIGQVQNKLYNKKPGNVFLRGNLYKQVQIAYAIPRKISLISVGKGNLFNLFPTDLHGAITDKIYVISLRHEGKACRQVEEVVNIALSDMDARTCKAVFRLGKNHMQPMKEKSEFEFFDGLCSKNFRLPLPKKLVAYKELQLITSFVHGIHKLLIFKIIHTESVVTGEDTLMHIHAAYATWRHKKGLESNYLLR